MDIVHFDFHKRFLAASCERLMAKVENCRVNGKEFHTQETSSGTKQSLRRKISQVKKK